MQTNKIEMDRPIPINVTIITNNHQNTKKKRSIDRCIQHPARDARET